LHIRINELFKLICPHLNNKKIFIETYGCQMNFADSEIVASVLKNHNYKIIDDYKNADIILVNTCAIRDNAEQRVRNKIQEFKHLKRKNPQMIIGILGCMAERLKTKILDEEKFIDMIVGPDAYRDLPLLLNEVFNGHKGINTILSHEETYADINPVRLNKNGVTAFISIMRGCQNYCSYCVVPFTRGKERSRDAFSIVDEAKMLFNEGYREITLLGQNVNSYYNNNLNFAGLLQEVAKINPLLRIRFATSHPKDVSEQLINTIAEYPNICKSVHLPAQSGSSRILKLMNRKYTREYYLDLIHLIRSKIPVATITTDLIAGFCTETDDDHAQTLSLMNQANFDFSFMFKYSERPDTKAANEYTDDVPEEIKIKRLNQIIALQNRLSLQSNKNDIGKIFEVLVEGNSKRNPDFLTGRNSQNKMIVFPKSNFKQGDYVNVLINDCTSATLKGEIIKKQF